jgi:hypothetical protein
MTIRTWVVATFFVVAAPLAGCSKNNKSVGGGSALAISAASGTAFANGSNTVVLHVSGAAAGNVTLTTTRGTLTAGAAGPGTNISVAGPTADVTLTTCNQATSGCAGTAHVVATDSALGSASVDVTFLGIAACTTNCAVDATCGTAGATCTLAGGGSGTCSTATPSTCAAPVCAKNPPGTVNETGLCSDGIDNDCNGFIDCADTSCNGQACKAGSPTFICQSGACTDVSSGLAITVTPDRTRLPADGKATAAVVVYVTKDGAAQSGIALDLTTDAAAPGGLSSATATTGADGKATVTFTATAIATTAHVTAAVHSVPLVNQTAAITMPALGQMALGAPVTYPVMGVRGSGYHEINQISVAVLDDKGLAYPDGLDVRFEHQQVGGSTLSTPLTADTATCLAATGCIGYQWVTNIAGAATFNLYSGTLAGTLAVVATTTAGGQFRTFQVPNVAVIGARANGSNFSIDCSPRNIPALADTNCHTSNVATQFTCKALLKDRFNNLLGTATQVTFVSEAAAVGQVTTTPAFDPAKDPASQANLGIASQIFNTLGAGLPAYLPTANPGEPVVDDPGNVCGWTKRHPRNGLVTIIAIADGEESFEDLNGNGVYDLGEPFIDLGEPFVDDNDNGVHDPGEWFLDVNGNGVYDGPNGVWDGATKIWTETRVIYTGVPAGPINTGLGSYYGVRWSDSGWGCTATPAPPAFSVNAAATPLPATSQQYFVSASDGNLNRLVSGTTYATAVETPGKVVVSYGGLPAYADDLGLFFRYQVCDQSASPNCADRCLPLGANVACHMKTSILAYTCGIAASVIVGGSSSSPGSGLNFVDWSVSTPYPVSVGTINALDKAVLPGTDN